MGNYEGKFSKPTTAPVKKESAPKKKKIPFRRKWNRFWRAVRKNQKYQTALWLILLILVCLVSRGCQSIKDKDKYEALMESQSADYEAQMEDMRLAHEQEINDLRAEYEEITPEEKMNLEAKAIARVLYGTARNNSERDQRTVVWCILNRVDSAGFPNTVEGVCGQASQWMGYNVDNPVLQNLYEVAKTELEKWYNGDRPVLSDYVYMTWSSKEVTLRDTYEKEAGTRYWQSN